MARYYFNNEWSLEIYQQHAIPKYRNQIYLYHDPDHKGSLPCDIGGRWVHNEGHPKKDMCHCNVKIPKKLWSKILMLRAARLGKLKL